MFKMRLVNEEAGKILITKELTEQEYTTLNEEFWATAECSWEIGIVDYHRNGKLTIMLWRE